MSERCTTVEETPDGSLVRTNSSEIDPPNMSWRMVLVGKTGTGKSSSGNTILGRKVFKAATSSSSVTRSCRKETGEVAGNDLILVDTPGLFDTDLSDKELEIELKKCIGMTAPGPHAIILVMQVGPFTEEEKKSVAKVRALFGQEATKYMIILFTHGDKLQGDLEKYINKAKGDLRKIIDECDGRCHVFDNTKTEDRTQVIEFLEIVENMVTSNGGENYTNTMYQDVEKILREKERKLRKHYEKKLEDQKAMLESKFREEKQQLEETIEKLKESDKEKAKKIKQLKYLDKKRDLNMKELQRYYHEKFQQVSQEAEQTPLLEIKLKEVLESIQSLNTKG